MTHAEPVDDVGIDPADLPDEDLLRELASLHRTRLDTLRHGSDAALDTHLRRTAALETEYLARTPGREVDPRRLREDDDEDQPAAAPRTGPWDGRPT
jgi:hypothetical protein